MRIKKYRLLFILPFRLLVFYLFLTVAFPVLAAETTIYLGGMERVFNNTGSLIEEKLYLPAGSGIVEKNRITVQSGNPTITVSYFYVDHLGSIVLGTGQAGTKTDVLRYYPYGSLAGGIKNTDNDRFYTGQRKDESSDLYFYNARYYDPRISHFISADKAEGPNRYAYVGNNPVVRNDPSGHREANPEKDQLDAYYHTQNKLMLEKAAQIEKKYGLKIIHDEANKGHGEYIFTWNLDDLASMERVAEKMAKKTKNPAILKGVSAAKLLCSGCNYAGAAIGDKKIAIYTAAQRFFDQKRDWRMDFLYLHELAHTFAPGYGYKEDEFNEAQKKDGITYAHNVYNTKTGESMFVGFAEGVPLKAIIPLMDQALTNMGEAFADFSAAYFDFSSFKGVTKYNTEEELWKAYPNTKKYLEKLWNKEKGDNNKIYQRGENFAQ